MDFLLTSEKQAIVSLRNDSQFIVPAFSIEETLIRVARVDRASSSQGSFVPLDSSNWIIRAGIGAGVDKAPTAGTWTFNMTAGESVTLPWNATAAQVQAAYNAYLPYSVTVTGENGRFTIYHNNTGSQTPITPGDNNLYPTSIIQTGTVVDGTSDKNEIQSIRLIQNAAAFVQLEQAYYPAGVTVNLISSGVGAATPAAGFSLLNDPYDGTWTITVDSKETGPIAWNADPDDVRVAVESLSGIGEGNVSVAQTGEYSYVVALVGTFLADTAAHTFSASGSNLKVIQWQQGYLDTRTEAIQQLLQSTENAAAFLEIEGIPIYRSPTKLLKTQVNLVAAVIDPGTVSPPVEPVYPDPSNIELVSSSQRLQLYATMGSEFVDFYFSPAFDTVPPYIIVQLQSQTQTDPIIPIQLVWSSVDSIGCRAVFGAAIPNGTYRAICIAHK